MRFSSFTQKALSAFLSLFFFTQCALANAPEANFWAERQKSVEKSRKESSQSLLAVGVSGEASSSLLQVLHRLPDVDGRSPIPALSKRLAKSLPEGFIRNNTNL